MYIPIYCRPPNKFIKYVNKNFNDKAGHTGTEIVALYTDRKNKLCEMTAQILWDIKNNG